MKTDRLYKACCAWAAVFLLAAALVQGAEDDFAAFGKPVEIAPADTAIAASLKDVSSEQIKRDIEKLVSFGTRNTLSSMATDLPPGQGINVAADWIETQFKAYSQACGGCLEVKRDTFTESHTARIPQPTTLVNVYAVLRGSDPAQASRFYLVTGHYDSRVTDVLDFHSAAPGANDDASGVAVSLECARVLSKHKFPATLIFAAVAGEEQGLNGSSHLAKLAKEEGWQLDGVLNNDIVGANTTPGDKLQDKSAVRVFSEGVSAAATPEQKRLIDILGAYSDSPSRELAREITYVARTYLSGTANSEPLRPVLVFRLDRFLRGGDHSSFNREGFPAVRFSEWREDFNHQHQNVRTENGIEYGDLLKFVDFGYVAKIARLNAATLAVLASAPGEPRDVRIVTRNLDNNSTLKWNAPAAPANSLAYEIVWRETEAPDWQRYASTESLGDSTTAAEHTATLPISKDNVIFGVRSVDAAGHRSAAVTPVPER